MTAINHQRRSKTPSQVQREREVERLRVSFAAGVRRRFHADGMRCEGCGRFAGDRSVEAHHVWNKGRSSEFPEHIANLPEMGAALCKGRWDDGTPGCHDLVHSSQAGGQTLRALLRWRSVQSMAERHLPFLSLGGTHGSPEEAMRMLVREMEGGS